MGLPPEVQAYAEDDNLLLLEVIPELQVAEAHAVDLTPTLLMPCVSTNVMLQDGNSSAFKKQTNWKLHPKTLCEVSVMQVA